MIRTFGQELEEVTEMGLLCFVNLEKDRNWLSRFMEQAKTSPTAEERVHKPQTRTKPESKEEPSLYYVEAGSATISVDGEVVAKLGAGLRYTGVLVPPGSTVQWNSGSGAVIKILMGEREIGEVVAPGGST